MRPEPEHLAIHSGDSAIVYGPEEDDDGELCHFQEWDMDALVLKPASFSLETGSGYHKALVFVLSRPYIIGFFSDWKYDRQDTHYFQCPQRVLRRRVRKDSRICIEGNITIRRKRATGLSTVVARLYDFSPDGASFYTDQADFAKNEMFLVEFEIPGCGTCETTATVARVESLNQSVYDYIVGIRFYLTTQQLKKAQQLLLCLKAERIQQMTDSSRYRWTPAQRTS